MPAARVNILLVEDSDLDARFVEQAFWDRQIQNPLIRARNASEALDILRGTPGSPALDKPYILLLDIRMPGMSGIELLSEIRADEKLAKSIAYFLTTSDDQHDIEKAYELNAAGYLRKTYVHDEFKAMIEVLNNFWSMIEFPPTEESRT